MMKIDSPTTKCQPLGVKKFDSFVAPGRLHELADGRRERHDAGREDHRDHAGHVHAQRQVGLTALGHAPADHALGVLHRDAPLAFLDEHDPGDDGEHDEGHHHLEDLVLTRSTTTGCPQGRRETIEAKISSEMPLPIPRWVISSPIHIKSTQPAVRQIDDQEDVGQRRTCVTTDSPAMACSEWNRKT